MKKKDIEELKRLIRASNYPEEYKRLGAVKVMEMFDP